MTDKEKFEAWYGEHYTTYLPKTGGGEYCNLSTLLAWNTWQASRRAALEESWEAVHAERLTDPTDSADDIAYNVAVQDCENAIRAISKDGQHD